MPLNDEQRAAHAESVRLGKERARQKREELAAKAAAAELAKEPEPSISVAEGEPLESFAQGPTWTVENEQYQSRLEDIDPRPLADPPEKEEPDDEQVTAFGRWVKGLDPDLLSLGMDELARIYLDNEKIAADEKRAERRKKAKERALHHAKAEAGLLPISAIEDKIWQDRMDQKVRLRVELPLLGESGQPVDSGLRIDGKIWLHDRVHEITRAQFDSFRDILYRAKQGELDFEGRSRSHWLRRQATGSFGEYVDPSTLP